MTDNVLFSSVQRILASVQRFMGTRSRTGSLRDDRRGARPGRLYGMKVLQVILTTVLVRIPAPREKGTDHRSRSVPFHSLLLVSEANSRQCSFKNLGAETSSDRMRRFRNDHTLSSPRKRDRPQDPVSPHFRSRLLVSEANVSNSIFLGCSRPSASNGFLIERLKDVKYEMLLDAANDIHRHFFPNELRDSILVRLPLARWKGFTSDGESLALTAV